jgi:hypothetical protein
MSWWANLNWPAATMVVCYALILVIGLFLLCKKHWPKHKHTDVIRRIGQFRDG